MRSARFPLLVLLAACASACSSTDRSRSGPAAAPAAAAAITPSLEQIFLKPALHGQPPSSRSLSADGRWLLFSWRPLVVDEDGRRLADDGSPRLISTFAPGAAEHRGVPLAEVIAQASAGSDEPAPGGRLVQAFFPTGADLAVASGQQLFILRPGASGDPRAWSAELALDLEDAEVAAGTPKLRSIQSIAFDASGAELFLTGGAARLAFDLAEPLPWDLAAGRATTREFPTGSRPRWSEDMAVAFDGNRPLARLDPATGAPLVPPEEDAGEVTDDEEQEEPAAELEAHVWLRAEDRYVVLEDWGDEGRPSLSPRGRHVLRTVTDESAAPEQALVPDYLTDRVTTRRARRQLADDAAYPQRTWIWDTSSGQRSGIVFPGDEDVWSTPIGWAPGRADPDPEAHAWMRVSPDFRVMQLWVWSRDELVQVFEERDPRWYGGPAARARWSADGRALIVGLEATRLSLTPGRNQLFAIDVETRAVRQLTEVAGEVSSFDVLDSGAIVFTASQGDPRRRAIGLVPAAAVTGSASGTRTWARTLSAPPGWNDSPRVSADGARVVFAHQTIGHPAELWTVATGSDTATGSDDAAPLRLTHTVPAAYEALAWIRPQPFQVEHADGTRVHAHVFVPPGSALERPDRPRATVVFIHGAGYLQNVVDSMTRYEVNLLFHSRLARMGYVVVDVDYRGSAGYGNAFRTDVQYQLGKLELEDIHLVLDELAAAGLVDPDRAACYGGSYGGFLTLMALFTAPERWVAGAALRSVTDWRTYHPRYTQPRLGRPSTHAEAYERSSPIDLAEGLEDPLLILHGLLDSNVFAQDSIRLVEELIDLGKDFEAMLYPSQGHAFEDGMHWLDEYKRIERFLIEHLGPP